jgi:signal peptidase I
MIIYLLCDNGNFFFIENITYPYPKPKTIEIKTFVVYTFRFCKLLNLSVHF